jgi:hypothetical protein
MIRNVVVGRLRQAADERQRAADQEMLRQGLAELAALRFPGLLAVHAGVDEGLREGGWDFAITNDWADADAYRGYDLDEEHNRIRRDVFAAICADTARVQFEIST